jgi:hypothetical protein
VDATSPGDARVDAAVPCPDAAPGPDAAPPTDLRDRLAALPGVTVTEPGSSTPGVRLFALALTQPVDHAAPGGASFQQHLTLRHRSGDAPLVLVTEGYYDAWGETPAELTVLLEANQLVVEHRFFGASVPDPMAWEHLTIAQAAADHHRVVEALRPLYPAAWISTGYSKGGMTAVFQRRFYPDDVEGTVAYVAPISYGVPDPRYLDFLATVDPSGCRDAVRSVQVEVLTRRSAMLARAQAEALSWGLSLQRIGGVDHALEAILLDLPFAFWQYAGVAACPGVPLATSPDDLLWSFVSDHLPLDWAADDSVDTFAPYYYQAHAELGYPAVATEHLGGLLLTDATSLEAGPLPPGTAPAFDASAMPDVADWVATQATRLMFVYGENDPWTAGAFVLGEAQDAYLFVAPQGTHAADLSAVPAGDRGLAYAALASWTGVPLPPPTAGCSPVAPPPPCPRSPRLARLQPQRNSSK